MEDDAKAEKPGYKKPPRNKRFKKGQSGNPKGRPKKKPTSSFIEDILEELTVEVEIVGKGGRKQKITMQQAIAKRLVTDAANGNASAQKAVERQLEKVPQTKPIPKIILRCGPDRTEENRRKVEEARQKKEADPNPSEETED